MNFDNLKAFMHHLTTWRIPGNTVVVHKDGKLVFKYSTGYSDLENKILMNGNEHFNLFSCSKPITVVAAMQLYEKGIFLLSDPLYDFMPEFKDMTVKDESGNITKAGNHITLHNLFTMTSGFSYNRERPWMDEAKKITNGKFNTVETLKCMAKEPLSFEPGEMWQYGLSHDVLAAVVEVVSGKKFRDYVKENIFEPLGMNDSVYHNESVVEKMAQQYRFVDDVDEDIVEKQSMGSKGISGRIENAGKDNYLVFGCEYDSGGAGVTATVDDYSKFANALAMGGVGETGERIISPATIELIHTSQLNIKQAVNYNWAQFKGYGYGLGVRTLIDKVSGGSNSSLGEFGWGGAAGATLLVDTKEKLSVAYAHHMLNPQEDYYQPRLRNVVYSCI